MSQTLPAELGDRGVALCFSNGGDLRLSVDSVHGTSQSFMF